MPSESATIAAERRALMDLMDKGPYKIPKRMVDENLLIATWNIQNLGSRHTVRALQYIADVVERFDIVALQELKSSLVSLGKLKQMLPGNYDVLVTDTTGNYERFAFLYDKRTVRSTGLVAEIGFRVPAKTHQGYQLHRMPYCASFRAGRFDFVIVNVHIYCGKTAAEKKQREEEIKVLAEHLAQESKKSKYAKVFDPDFFVLGDFNIEELGDKFFKALTGAGFKMPSKMGTLKTNFGQTATFDKIAWIDRPSFRFSGKCNVVPFKQAVYQGSQPAGGKKEISDHLPLWAEFRVNELTQELDAAVRSAPPSGG